MNKEVFDRLPEWVKLLREWYMEEEKKESEPGERNEVGEY